MNGFGRVAMSVTLGLMPVSAPALAASFDCGKATTPFERAICTSPELSAADLRLSRTYDTAIGGLSKTAAGTMRTNQREWLSYAQRACTLDAMPMTSGAYDEDGLSCLVTLFNDRSQVLETSRMLDGYRFYPLSQFAALPDPYQTEEPRSSWAVAKHELNIIQLDDGTEAAGVFNDLVQAEGRDMSAVFAAQGGAEQIQTDDTSDSTVSISLKETAGTKRITLGAMTYWYGHGAAHGNGTLEYLHFLVEEQRWMEPGDLFSYDGWEEELLKLTLAALEAEHGDNLMLDEYSPVDKVVVDPRRWDFSNRYGLTIRFQPYEIAAYAYGAPTALVRWEVLEPYLAASATSVRLGF